MEIPLEGSEISNFVIPEIEIDFIHYYGKLQNKFISTKYTLSFFKALKILNIKHLPGLQHFAMNWSLPARDCICLFVAYFLVGSNQSLSSALISFIRSGVTDIVSSLLSKDMPKNVMTCAAFTDLCMAMANSKRL